MGAETPPGRRGFEQRGDKSNGDEAQGRHKKEEVEHKSYVRSSRAVGMKEKKFPRDIVVRYLYQPGELEGGSKRATDPNWTLKTYKISKSVTKKGQPVVYYLDDGPSRGFVKEELLIVPSE